MAGSETYLKTQQVAKALGVSVSTIKRWVDAGAIDAIRTMGRHRLVTLSSALKFARQENFSVDNLLSIGTTTPLATVDSTTINDLANLLKLGRAREARGLIASVFRRENGGVVLADQLIRPVMESIGQGWMLGSWDIYQEHQATQIISSALNALISELSLEPNQRKPLALGATPQGDSYSLASLLCELVLRDVGWNVQNLGHNLPLRSLASALREYRPRLVYLSASHIADRDGFLRDYAYFYEAASQVGSAIMLGGRGFDYDLRSNLIYASFGDRTAHLAEFARRIMPTSGESLDSP